ncbi:hypothetical protein OE88DRAFT_916771 [Heliocybe sulcata]|uniref:Uncharacterized protein n=1 Tax=Heliocybe sulcata TaxID=5364 RepID=A0A5C3MNU1_9AGAM|nr:hypothetical protein OE88DRAFT_916771 [Heliocybe sulcata]
MSARYPNAPMFSGRLVQLLATTPTPRSLFVALGQRLPLYHILCFHVEGISEWLLLQREAVLVAPNELEPGVGCQKQIPVGVMSVDRYRFRTTNTDIALPSASTSLCNTATMPEPQNLNHDATTYLTVTLASSISPSSLPSSLNVNAEAAVALDYLGNVGELKDVHLVGVPKEQWETWGSEIVQRLQARPGVTAVQVVAAPSTRRKRDEF